jgi:hypothetical protein
LFSTFSWCEHDISNLYQYPLKKERKKERKKEKKKKEKGARLSGSTRRLKLGLKSTMEETGTLMYSSRVLLNPDKQPNCRT